MALGHSPSIIVDSSLYSWFDFTNTNSYVAQTNQATIYSLIGNGYNWSTANFSGTVNTTSYGTIAKGLLFDGNAQMLTQNGGNSYYYGWDPTGTYGTPTLTNEMWVYPYESSGVLYTRPWNGSGRYNVWVYTGSFFIASGGSSSSQPSSTINYAVDLTTFGKPVHIVCWANQTQVGYYINGGQYSGSQNHGITGSGDFYGNGIGAGYMTLYPYGQGWGGNTGLSINGVLYQARVYNRVLTASEVQRNFAAHAGRYGY
jgi:hypothetical protein